MKPSLLFLPLSLALLLTNALHAEVGPIGFGTHEFEQPLESDRPDFTEGTQTVEAGHVQFEMGYTYTDNDNDNIERETHTGPELLSRVGITDMMELRLFWEGYVSAETHENGRETSDLEGATDFSVGFKHEILYQDGWIPDFSFLGELSIPVGDSDLSTGEVGATAKLAWAYDLHGPFGVAGNFNFANYEGVTERVFEFGMSVSGSIDVTDASGIYFEYFGLYPESDVPEDDRHFLGTGYTYLVNDNMQLDVRIGSGLNDSSEDLFTGAGVVFRL